MPLQVCSEHVIDMLSFIWSNTKKRPCGNKNASLNNIVAVGFLRGSKLFAVDSSTELMNAGILEVRAYADVCLPCLILNAPPEFTCVLKNFHVT